MCDLARKAMLVLGLSIWTSSAHTQEWQVTSGTNPQGFKSVSMSVQQFEFSMQFYCDERDWEDNRMGVKFFGPTLPRLYGADGDKAKLSILFTLRDDVLYRESWDAYYFDGGIGDQAWLGTINAGRSELNALARALKLDILNQEGELVYSFGTKGTALGIAKVRKICKFED